jgi:cellobiose phosphorylase
VAAGLAEFRGRRVEYLLHPRDRRTGVSYRLLPMTRGMLAGLFTPAQVKAHLAVIVRALSFPDGVRLIDRPLAYHGGIERTFKRAETAANFGREIGLQYVHAHIRYIEAMARIGQPEKAWQGLLAVLPITLDQIVPGALPRQSNCYFSSSDAAFDDRYQARKGFAGLRTGRVPVKGGWRVYSSGPGIYLNQLISNVLGLREYYENVLLDPVLPRRANGLTFDFTYNGKRVRYVYRVRGKGFSPDRVRINGRAVATARYADHPYRRGGMLIPKQEFAAALDRDENVVEMFI